MSLKDVRTAVERFLKSDSPQAISISGKWGSGKTYFWNQVIKSASQQGLVKKYSYVSLFGTNNLAELKSAIFDCIRQGCGRWGKLLDVGRKCQGSDAVFLHR
ncbi:hypothetical protein DWU98_19300 [Dyella monticola]|uniref:KAP NTPase domain-containing protein n=1 Tax=Dyella monticola TaxID=1927958 RepID=A0A370WSP5_9GAMM|nr:P-loop NTPase fold protein [Dyella monticola]RDS79152.1 hypothetical protein DWU98_19300 [Dyella monticola]